MSTSLKIGNLCDEGLRKRLRKVLKVKCELQIVHLDSRRGIIRLKERYKLFTVFKNLTGTVMLSRVTEQRAARPSPEELQLISNMDKCNAIVEHDSG